SDGNGGPTDGGADGNTGGECGATYCAASQTCVAESVCVSTPDRPAQACVEDEDNVFTCQGNADLACHNAAACAADTDCPTDHAGVQLACRQGLCGIPAPAGPATVTYRGCVDAFGIGDVTDNMRVALYRADQDPTGASAWDMATVKDEAGCEYWGAFEFTEVPTNTPLILKSYDPSGGFITTYKHNLVLYADLAADEGGTFVFDTRASAVSDPRTGLTTTLHPWRGYAISQPTFSVILLAVGISSLPDGQGGIAGTMRDCQYRELQHVRCGVWQDASVLTYFTNAENPRPERNRDATNVNGIFAAIGLPEGTHTVACMGQNAAGECVLIGKHSVKVFSGAVSIVNMDWHPGL
ncbi:MAG TPA: hypothetical protein P5076_13405, partial [Myxococcota bacterium]|nr:hypothetical protein [Myxococcota bacterium]